MQNLFLSLHLCLFAEKTWIETLSMDFDVKILLYVYLMQLDGPDVILFPFLYIVFCCNFLMNQTEGKVKKFEGEKKILLLFFTLLTNCIKNY